MTTLATSRSLRSVLREIAADIKLAHSVFALPFALLAAFMAALGRSDGSGDWTRFSGQIGLIVLAMIFARTCAMLANRLIDRHLDATNPRTAKRPLPAGRLSAKQATAALIASAIFFMVTCAAFGIAYGNWWPLILGAPVLAWLCSYAFLKRFTWLCHLYLGSSLAISPLAATLAIDPSQLSEQPGLWLLSAFVLFWVAGFDVIYALQDIEVDRAQGLSSIPARFGVKSALWLCRGLHLLAAAALITIWLIDARFGWLFGIGAALALSLLVSEHATVARWGTTKIALAFFTLNRILSCVFGACGIFDLLGVLE